LAVEGYRALQQKDYQTALDRFRRADALVHAPTLVVDWARALIGLGQLVQAHEKLQSVLREGVDPKAPAPWQRALSDAQTELDKLKPRLAWLTITVSGPNEPRVTLDGEVIENRQLGTPRPTNPGARVVRVTAQGFKSVRRDVKLGEGDEERIDLIMSSVVEESASPVGASGASQSAAPANSERSEVMDTRRVSMYAAFGLGGAGIVAGSIFGVLALNKRSALEDACPERERCPPSERSTVETYRTLGTLSGVGFGVGLVGTGAGLALLLTQPGKPKPERAQAFRIQPVLGLNGLGAAGQF
jgi:hypothetical protein